MIVGWAKVMAGQFERLPKRPRLFSDINVPLPGETAAEAAPAG
jgi:hypothetical protein